MIDGSVALEAGLNPATDALALGAAEGNPSANVLVVQAGHEQEPAIQTLVARLLTGPEVRAFIEERYQGAVIPAAPAADGTPVAGATPAA